MLWRILAHEQDVLDAYQECICRLIARRRPVFRGGAHRYLYRTAANVAVDVIRRRQLLRRHQDPLAHHLQARQETRPPDQAELIALLRAAIVRLPAHLRDVILLRDLGQMSYYQVASILGVTAGTARVYRRQAIIRLAALLDTNEVRP
jgi:RNA polymerase sigma-70 factor (ECF subfamily)